MKAQAIKEGIYWVGAIDWDVRDFHGYKTNRGTTYNAYLIIDEKIVLVDTVKSSHTHEMMDRIKSIIDPSKIDIVISNHVEMDHSGSLQDIFNLAPQATLVTSPKGEKGLSEHYDTSSWKTQTVKSGESVNIGKRTISFLHTPMLHWPDSMISYIPEDKLLLPNDAFGQHLASEHVLNEEVPYDMVMAEAAKYYANIIYPFGAQAKKAVEALADLEIDMIAPSHGIVWKKNVKDIIGNYHRWANCENSGKALIIYDSMWGSTEKISYAIRSAFEDNDIPVVQRNLKSCHISDIMADMLEAKYVAIGSPVLNSQILPSIGALLVYMKGLRPKQKIGFAYGSYGWSHAGINEIESLMGHLKWKLPLPVISVKYIPKKEDLDTIKENINKAIKEMENDQ